MTKGRRNETRRNELTLGLGDGRTGHVVGGVAVVDSVGVWSISNWSAGPGSLLPTILVSCTIILLQASTNAMSALREVCDICSI